MCGCQTITNAAPAEIVPLVFRSRLTPVDRIMNAWLVVLLSLDACRAKRAIAISSKRLRNAIARRLSSEMCNINNAEGHDRIWHVAANIGHHLVSTSDKCQESRSLFCRVRLRQEGRFYLSSRVRLRTPLDKRPGSRFGLFDVPARPAAFLGLVAPSSQIARLGVGG